MKYPSIIPISFTAIIAVSTSASAAKPEHVERLLTTNQCPQCDLTNANLQDA
ncbi:MAG: pentapeptide repeat-containing protein, partial [Okeania sp. SIO2D1]|nr:pentapeptide repeat-containing protein [Okeania sp. SIO2D1]